MTSIRDLNGGRLTDASPVRPIPVQVIALVRGVIWALMALIAVRTAADPDLWGNVRFGLDMLAAHRIPTVDVYSFTSDMPWINHSWLAQLCMAIAYKVGGTPGLVLLKTSIVGLVVWLVYGAFRGARPLVAETATAVVLIGALPITLTLRAQLWTFLFVAVLCRILAARSAAYLIALPPLFVIWANCHAGWTIGLGLLVLWAAEAMWAGDRRRRMQAVTVTLAAVLATLANPYGSDLWTFSARVAHLSRGISEWQPLWTAPIGNSIPFVAAVVLVAIYGRSKPRLRWDRLLCLAGLAFVSVRVQKFAPIFVEVAVFFLAPASHGFEGTEPVELPVPVVFRRVNAVAFAALAVVVGITMWPSFTCLSSGDWHPDAAAARALIDANPSGRIAVWFDWGEYVIWHLGPRLRVSFDPRYDLLYSSATITEQRAIDEGTSLGMDFLQRSRPEYAWYPHSKTALKSWLADHGYRIDVDTTESFVAVRSDVPPLRNFPAVPFGCFPAP
jgi:hypothetical protein